MLATLFLAALVFFLASYRWYGRFMARKFAIDNKRKTPAESMYDGVDYCPAHPAVLLGHHFSSIAGASPIIGPITAAAWFGWLPAYVWCLIGSAFMGGPHDTGSLIASIQPRRQIHGRGGPALDSRRLYHYRFSAAGLAAAPASRLPWRHWRFSSGTSLPGDRPIYC